MTVRVYTGAGLFTDILEVDRLETETAMVRVNGEWSRSYPTEKRKPILRLYSAGGAQIGEFTATMVGWEIMTLKPDSKVNP